VATSLAVAGSFAAVGYWPIVPFAGLELAALGAAMSLSMRRARRRELIDIDERTVRIRKMAAQRDVDVEFQRPWTRVELEGPASATWPSRLWLRSMGRRIEVGAFLTDAERSGLRHRLAEVIAGPTRWDSEAGNESQDTRSRHG
jgi:uncharacterized membrane protein